MPARMMGVIVLLLWAAACDVVSGLSDFTVGGPAEGVGGSAGEGGASPGGMSPGGSGSGGTGLGGMAPVDELVTSLQGLLIERPCVTPTDDFCQDVDTPTDARVAAGAEGTTYSVDMHVRAVVEVDDHTGGSADGMMYSGGTGTPTYDDYMLTIDAPFQSFFLNHTTDPERQTYPVDQVISVEIEAGSGVTLWVDGDDDECLQNLDENDMPVSVDGTLLPQPYDGQFVYIEVLSAAPL